MSTSGVLQTIITEAEFDEMYCEQSIENMQEQILLTQQKIDAIRNCYLDPISIELSTYLDTRKVYQVHGDLVRYLDSYNVTTATGWAIDSTSSPNIYQYNVNQLSSFQAQTCKIYDATSGLYIDVTNEMNSGNYNDVPLPPFQQVAREDAIYLGNPSKFYQIRLDVGTAGSYDKVDINWEYYDQYGNWVPLIFRGVHGSPTFRIKGINRYTFNAPDDWAETIIDASQAYWIRAVSTWGEGPSFYRHPFGTRGWISTGWDDDPFIEEAVDKWNWGYDYIYHSPGTTGSYGLQPQITGLNSAIQITNANKAKYRSSKTYFKPYVL